MNTRYGGTKTEMERLLADAEKISGIKYDISNLNDVYSAIHVIQGELGITGTTAKEAATTIQGSAASMKSAWKNLITGIGDEYSDIHGLIEEFVSSVTIVLDNVVPVIDSIVDNIITGLKDKLPMILEKGSELLTTLLQGISSKIGDIMPMVVQIINTLVNTLVSNLPLILNTGIQILLELVKGISQTLPTLIPQMINAVVSMVETLLDNIDLIIDAGIQLILGLSDGLMNALPDLIDKIPVIIDKLINAIVEKLPKLIEAGITLTIKLAEGLIKAIPQLVSKTPKIIGSLINGLISFSGKLVEVGMNLLGKVKDGIVSGISSIKDVGVNLVKGLWNGINNKVGWILDKIKGFGKSVLNGIKKIFGIHSPSTIFRDEIGVNLAKGIGIGFEKEMKDVNNTIQNALPTDLGVKSKINLSTSASLAKEKIKNSTPNKVENNTYNFYNVKDTPSEYARKIRKERLYLEMIRG